MTHPPYGSPQQPWDNQGGQSPYPPQGPGQWPGQPGYDAGGFGGPPPKKSQTPIWIALGVLVALAAAVVTIVLVNRGKDEDPTGGGPTTTTEQVVDEEQAAKDVVGKFLDAATSGDAEETKKYVCPELKESIDDADLSGGEKVDYEIGDAEVDGDKAEVLVHLNEDGDQYDGLVILEKSSDDIWEVCDLKNADSSGSGPTS